MIIDTNVLAKNKRDAESRLTDAISEICNSFREENTISIDSVSVSFANVSAVGDEHRTMVVSSCSIDLAIEL